MDNVADERDFALLAKDKYTFYVLRRILDGGCELLLTDHETLILCFSCDPFPVWIWTTDGAPQAEMERAYKEAMSRPLLNGKLFNMKYDLANYFIKRAAEDGKTLSVCKNMFAYDCPNPIKPTQSADGCLFRCGADDIETLTDLIEEFHSELQLDKLSRERYRMDAEQSVASGNTGLRCATTRRRSALFIRDLHSAESTMPKTWFTK